MQKKGMGVVAASVLIIMIVVVAAALVWGLVIPMVSDVGFGEAGGELSIVTAEGYTVYDESNGLASVQVKRGDDNSDLRSIDVVFSVEGESVKFTIPKDDVLERNSGKLYKFNLSEEGEPESVKVVPAFSVGRGPVTGEVVASGEVVGDVKLKKGSVVEDGIIYSLNSDVGDEPDPDYSIRCAYPGGCSNNVGGLSVETIDASHYKITIPSSVKYITAFPTLYGWNYVPGVAAGAHIKLVRNSDDNLFYTTAQCGEVSVVPTYYRFLVEGEPLSKCGGGVGMSQKDTVWWSDFRQSSNGNYLLTVHGGEWGGAADYYFYDEIKDDSANYFLTDDSETLIPGDANGDCIVSAADYTIWADNFGATDATWAMGDFNGDRSVTAADYTIWADNFEAVCEGVCIDSDDCEDVGTQKNMTLYSDKELFLISDKNWKDVLPFVSATVWTGDESVCQRGYNTPDGVCVYPMLIYHEEEKLSVLPLPERDVEGASGYEEVYSVDGKSLVRIYLDDLSKEQFLKTDLDVAKVGKDYVDVVLADGEKDYFEDAGYNLETIPVSVPSFDGGEGYDLEEGYHTYESMVEELNGFELAYPEIAKVYDLGDSVEGRNILAVKVSDNVETEEDEAEILIVGNHHAREIMTVEVPIFMIGYFLENYAFNEGIKDVVDNHELWFVPMVNPDGHVIVETEDMLWRKNARDNNEDGIINWEDGVDLNRNYGFTWGYDDFGSSPSPSSNSYRGTEEFSEPETQAIRDLVLDHDFQYVLDYHSSGGYVLYPWGHIFEKTDDDDTFEELSRNFKAFLPQYVFGQISELMYLSNGDSIDWHYGNQSILAFGFELNPEGGFSPPASYIEPTSMEQIMVLLSLTGYPIEYDVEEVFDVDSIIYFMQQYSPDKVTIVGETPQELDDLLVAEQGLGAGLSLDQVKRIDANGYLSYWESYEKIVYVEEDYGLALLASSYASLNNVPMVIEGSSWDVSGVFSEKEIICVGDVSPSGASCDVEYSLDELRAEYLDRTKTKKIVMVNPNDLEIFAEEILDSEKSGDQVSELYRGASLVSPFLASAKHELIMTEDSGSFEKIDEEIGIFFDNSYDENIFDCLYSDDCADGFANNPVSMTGARDTITFFLSGDSDLIIDDIDFSGEILANAEVEISVEVANIGFDVASDSVLEVYEISESSGSSGGGGGGGIYSSYSSEFVLIDSVEIGDIVEDVVENVVVSWTPTEVGSKVLWFNVSTSSNESNDNNNDVIRYVQVLGPAPDVSLSVERSDKMMVGSPNEVNLSVSNIGSEVAEDFDVEFFRTNWECSISTCSQVSVLINSVHIDSLSPGDVEELVLEFAPAEERWYDFLIRAEVSGDANSFNNEIRYSSRSVTQEPSISYGWRFFPEPVLVNQEHVINLSLWNYGFEEAQNTVVDFHIRKPSGDDYEFVKSVDVGNLEEDERIVSFDWLPVEVGYYSMKFNVSYEYSGGVGNREIWIREEAKVVGPDVEGWFYFENVQLGQEAMAEIRIYNEGNEIAENISYSFYDNGELIKSKSFSMALEPSRSFSDTIYWTPVGIGAHELELVVECNGDVDLEDNSRTRTMYVHAMRNVTFDVMDNEGESVSKYLGFAYDGNNPLDINLVSGPELFTIPDTQTDIWFIDRRNIGNSFEESVAWNFRRSDLHKNMFAISENYLDVRHSGDKRLYQIYANEVFWNYDYSSIEFEYNDYHSLGVEGANNLTIYYCVNWNFDSEICLSGWEEVGWVDKYVSGDYLYMRTNVESVEAYSVGEPIVGEFGAELRDSGEKVDFAALIDEYEKKLRFVDPVPFGEGLYYQLFVPGFFSGCSDSADVNISFNDELVKETSVDCYSGIPSSVVESYLGGYVGQGVKNITLDFDSDLIFYDSSELIGVYKSGSHTLLGEGDSSGVEIIDIASFGAIGDSEFVFENNNYTYFVVDVESSGTLVDFNVYLNDELVGELDLSNSNGRKARGFEIPLDMLGEEEFNVTVSSKNPGASSYLADVKMKSDFDDYYLTIVASPDAIPFQDDSRFEADIRGYGDLDGDYEAELSVGRIMGITVSDVSSYLSRVLFYDDIEKKSGATVVMMGDSYGQGIPMSTCGTGFCKCYFDSECPELFSAYEAYFEPFETCNQDLIGGQPQERGTSDCEEDERLRHNILYNSSISIFADHAGARGWSGIIYTDDLEDMPPEFAYSFGCATCKYRSAKSDLFCTNMIRRGAIGYIGAVENMYGHHFLNEFLDENLINNQSIGYAFKVGKNNEVRYDWLVKVFREDRMGVHDVLIGDPTFEGGFGL